MSATHFVLLLAAILVFCGLLQRVLDRMYLTDRQALAIIFLMFAGTWFPGIKLGGITINIAGALIPVGICLYLFIKADSAHERLRTVIGSVISALVIYLVSKLLPAEAEAMTIDPIWAYGICGGVIAWLLGRSRRAAFICGIIGTLLADTLNFVITVLSGYDAELYLGGGGIADAGIISGVTAVLLCETIGEFIERMLRGKRGMHE